MKTSILLIILVSLGVASISLLDNKKPVPKVVLEALAKKHPLAQAIEWEKEAEEYEADFVQDGVPMSANFTLDGQWLESERTIEIAELPQAVNDLVTEYDATAAITEAEIVERPERPIAYEVKVSGKTAKVELLISMEEQGAILEQISQVKPEDEDTNH